jgi:ribonuclease BN (tRNA processing enzyme)
MELRHLRYFVAVVEAGSLSEAAENPEGTEGVPRALHVPPSVIGAIAKSANVHRLVLSHRMLRTLGHEEETLKVIARSYAGPVDFANDLDCFR